MQVRRRSRESFPSRDWLPWIAVPPRADRPNWFVRDHDARDLAVVQPVDGSPRLRNDTPVRCPGFALLECFTNGDDRGDAVRERGANFQVDGAVEFGSIHPAFGMAEDHV